MTEERILIVDDDAELIELAAEYLEMEGFDIAIAEDGLKGVQRATTEEFALVALDVMMPGLNGFEALKRIRAVSQVPVLMLTARGDAVDRIVGLEIGADDYMSKPFNPRELAARIRAILRRARAVAPAEAKEEPTPQRERVSVGDVEMDMGSRTVRRGGETITLTSAEFDVLAALLKMAGKVATREALVREAMGRDLLPFERAIDMHVSAVRRKLGGHSNGMERIKAVRSVGYLYTLPEEG